MNESIPRMEKHIVKIIDILMEVSKIELVESAGVKQYIISGPFTKVDEPNGNNRIYPKEVMQKAIEKCKKKVAKKQIRMSLDHPDWTGKLADAAALLIDITDIKEDGRGYYKAQIVDTSKGKDLKALLDAGATIGVSTRGYGEALYDQDWPGLPGKYTVIKEGFELETIDFVDTPSVTSTMDDITLECKKRSETSMKKTLEELRKENPEVFADLDKAHSEEIQKLAAQIETLKTQVASASENFQKVLDLIKTVSPASFTVAPESEALKQKDSTIETMKKEIEKVNAESTTLKTQIQKVETEKLAVEREKKIESLKAENPDLFKTCPTIIKKFETCNTPDEIQKVFEDNKALLDEFKKNSNPSSADPKTPKTDVTKTGKTELTAEQLKHFNGINMDRKMNALPAYSEEEYLKRYASKK